MPNEKQRSAGPVFQKIRYIADEKERGYPLAEKRLRDTPVVITIDLTEELSNNWLQAARLTEKAEKGDEEAAAKMKDLKKESPSDSS